MAAIKNHQQKITPFLWFNDNVEESVKFYTSIFKNSKIVNAARYDEAGAKASGRPKGSVMTMAFKLEGQEFVALNGGPIFKLNPSISFFAVFDNEKDIEAVWNKLIKGGKALMPYNTYPWAHKYGWVQDR